MVPTRLMFPIRLPSLLSRLKVRCLFGFSLQSTNEVLRVQEEASCELLRVQEEASRELLRVQEEASHEASRELLRVQEEASRELLRVQEEASRAKEEILREVIGEKEEILREVIGAKEEILRVKDEAALLADVAHRLKSEKQALLRSHCILTVRQTPELVAHKELEASSVGDQDSWTRFLENKGLIVVHRVNRSRKVVQDNKGKNHTATTLAAKYVQIWRNLSSRSRTGLSSYVLTDLVGLMSRYSTPSFRFSATRQSVSTSTAARVCYGLQQESRP